MKNLPLLLIALTFMLSSCNNDDEITLPKKTKGTTCYLLATAFSNPTQTISMS